LSSVGSDRRLRHGAVHEPPGPRQPPRGPLAAAPGTTSHRFSLIGFQSALFAPAVESIGLAPGALHGGRPGRRPVAPSPAADGPRPGGRRLRRRRRWLLRRGAVGAGGPQPHARGPSALRFRPSRQNPLLPRRLAPLRILLSQAIRQHTASFSNTTPPVSVHRPQPVAEPHQSAKSAWPVSRFIPFHSYPAVPRVSWRVPSERLPRKAPRGLGAPRPMAARPLELLSLVGLALRGARPPMPPPPVPWTPPRGLGLGRGAPWSGSQG